MSKYYVTPLLGVFLLSACKSGTDSNSPPVNPTTDSKPLANCIITSEQEELCLPDSMSGEAGSLVSVELTGELPTSNDLKWVTSAPNLTEMTLPNVYVSGKKATFVLPPTSNDFEMKLEISELELPEGEVLSMPINVKGQDSLILNGVNSIVLNEQGDLELTWLSAVTLSGSYPTEANYFLEVTRLENGHPTQDTVTLETTELSLILPVMLSESYRITLSVNSNGVRSYSAPIIYDVADTAPTLKPVSIINNPKDINPDDHQIGDLFNLNGKPMVVRKSSRGSKELQDAAWYDMYEPDSPLVFSGRLVSLSEQEIIAHSHAKQNFTANTAENHIELDIPSNTPRAYARTSLIESKIPKSRLSLCEKLSKGSAEISFCFNEISETIIDYKSAMVSGKYITTFKVGMNANFEVQATVKGKVELPPATIRITGVSLSRDIPFLGPVKVDIGVDVGVKSAIVAGPKFYLGTKIRTYAKGHVQSTVSENSLGIPEVSLDLDVDVGFKPKPLYDDSYYKFEGLTLTSNTPVELELFTGVFPIFKISDDEIKTSLGAKGKFVNNVRLPPEQPPLAKDWPNWFSTGGTVSVSASGNTEADVNFFGFDFKNASEIELSSYDLFKAPSKVEAYLEAIGVCHGSSKYPDDLPPIMIPEFGTLGPGDNYGEGSKWNEIYKFRFNQKVYPKYKYDKSFKYDDKLNMYKVAYIKDKGFVVNFIDSIDHETVNVKLAHKFTSGDFLQDLMFPIWAFDEAEYGQGPAWSPWACWGAAYNERIETRPYKEFHLSEFSQSTMGTIWGPEND